MQEERRIVIEQTIADLKARGEDCTTHQVHRLVGGNYPELVRYLRERRAGPTSASPQLPAPARAAVAVLERPATLAEPVPAEPKPKLVEARERAQAYARSASQASQAERAMTNQITPLQIRLQELTAARATVGSVEALRALKAEIGALEEQVEVLTIQHRPLASNARAQSEALARARQHYEQVRVQAILAWQNARPTANDWQLAPEHVRQLAHDRARSVREITELIGEEEVEKYITCVSRGDSSSRVPPIPPWVSRSELP